MAHIIPTRPLGNSGVKVGEIGLGCMMMFQTTIGFGATGSDPSIPKEPWFQTMKKAIEMGCNFFDTGEFYGDNELVLNEFFSKHPGSREKVFLSVKAGLEKMVPNGQPEFLKRNIDFNLNRLGISKIDLYQMARVDPKIPIEISVAAVAECIKEGKVGHIGLSECSADTIRRAHKVHPITAVEIEYSLWNLDPEQNGVLKTCEELGIAIIAYSPLGRGMLTGTFKSPEDAKVRQMFPRFQGENFYKNLELVKAIEKIAQKHGVTPSQLCIAWVLRQSPLIIPIPGTTKAERVVENLASTKITLSDEDLKEIRTVVSSFEIVGDRYPAFTQHLCHGESLPLEKYTAEHK